MSAATYCRIALVMFMLAHVGCSAGGADDGGAAAGNSASAASSRAGAGGVAVSVGGGISVPARAAADGGAGRPGSPSSPSSPTASAGGVPTRPPVPTTPGALTIVFSPMYSAFDGVHEFESPAVTIPAVQDAQWFVEPPEAAELAPDANTGVVLIKMREAGDFKVFATSGQVWGLGDLHVTLATPEQWARGEARYRNDAKLDDTILPAATRAAMPDLPDNAACGNCHGAGARVWQIEHTPQQIGGYSDEVLVTLLTTGLKATGSPFRSELPASVFRAYHTWENANEAEAQSVVVYLRSLKPRSQSQVNFAPSPRR